MMSKVYCAFSVRLQYLLELQLSPCKYFFDLFCSWAIYMLSPGSVSYSSDLDFPFFFPRLLFPLTCYFNITSNFSILPSYCLERLYLIWSCLFFLAARWFYAKSWSLRHEPRIGSNIKKDFKGILSMVQSLSWLYMVVCFFLYEKAISKSKPRSRRMSLFFPTVFFFSSFNLLKELSPLPQRDFRSLWEG